MPHIKTMTTIRRSADSIYAFITDPRRVATIIPGVLSVSNVKNYTAQPGETFSWSFQLLGLPFRGTWHAVIANAPLLYVSRTTGGISSRWTYSLVPLSTQRTKVTLDIEYGPPSSVVRQFTLSFIEPHVQRLAQSYLDNLKHLLETLPKTPTR